MRRAPLDRKHRDDRFACHGDKLQNSLHVIQGPNDLFAPTPLAKAYFDKVSAPKKQFVNNRERGHFALATHQAT